MAKQIQVQVSEREAAILEAIRTKISVPVAKANGYTVEMQINTLPANSVTKLLFDGLRSLVNVVNNNIVPMDSAGKPLPKGTGELTAEQRELAKKQADEKLAELKAGKLKTVIKQRYTSPREALAHRMALEAVQLSAGKGRSYAVNNADAKAWFAADPDYWLTQADERMAAHAAFAARAAKSNTKRNAK